ncbi:glycosyltransferase [Furfurilactobacillus curtus]|uniref:Glycosyl transferase family 1 n=1 Tax=Furfurilactobacillus curtus TaxID=1746200 RepID=A0ABQ5JRG1_9LACO
MVKRILHFQGRMGLGGAESFMMNIFRTVDLSEFVFDFVIYDTYKDVTPYNDEIKKMGGKIFVLPDPNRHFFKYIQELFRLLRTKNFFAVENEIYFGGGINLLLALICGIKTRVAVSHATSDGKGFTRTHLLLAFFLKKLLITTATDLVAVSEDAGNSLFLGKQFLIVPNGIDLAKFVDAKRYRKSNREKMGIEENTVVGINIGRLEKQKNQTFLIDLVDSMNQRQKNNFKLFIVGTGSLLDELESLSRAKGLEDIIVFLGERTDIDQLLSMSDIFLLPSLYEGLPTVGIEAQAAGLKSIFSQNISSEIKLTNECLFLPISSGSFRFWITEIFKSEQIVKTTSRLFFYDNKVAAKKLMTLYRK